jgi:hypothetical protein
MAPKIGNARKPLAPARAPRTTAVAPVPPNEDSKSWKLGAANSRSGRVARAQIPLVPIPALSLPPSVTQAGSAATVILNGLSEGKYGPELVPRLKGLLEAPGFSALNDKHQGHILRLLAELTAEVASQQPYQLSLVAGGIDSLTQLARHPTFAALNPAQKESLLDTFGAVGGIERLGIIALLGRTMLLGKPPVARQAVLDVDAHGHTLLENLKTMHLQLEALPASVKKQGLDPMMTMLASLSELTDPGQINQGNRGTCTATSLQYQLVKENPAEYARLLIGLMSADGKVQLRNGDWMSRVTDSIATDDNYGRSESERLFQAAVMNYGRAGYSNATGGGTGLEMQQVNRASEGLFGGKFHVFDGADPNPVKAMFEKKSQSAARVLQKFRERSGQLTITALRWSPKFAHAVAVEGIRGDRVFYRNPWGKDFQPDSAEGGPPSRRPENDGLESISVADFIRLFDSAVVPD